MSEDKNLLFTISDTEGQHTPESVAALLLRAEKMGHPLEKDSYIQNMTVEQLDSLVNGRFDA